MPGFTGGLAFWRMDAAPVEGIPFFSPKMAIGAADRRPHLLMAAEALLMQSAHQTRPTGVIKIGVFFNFLQIGR